MQKKETETFCPASRQDWRQWLLENHLSKQSVWLVYHKMRSGMPTIPWSEAVDEALCFGWIDSTKKTLDADTFMQYFCKRKAGSGWSKINKGKVQRLLAEGLVMQAGHECIDTAKKNSSWILLDNTEELKIPKDLAMEFKSNPGLKKYFLGLSRSARKSILQSLALAKRPETRQKRVDDMKSKHINQH